MRPSTAKTLAGTPLVQKTVSGVIFQWNLDGWVSVNHADGGLEKIEAIIAWEDADEWLADVLGYTTWDGSSPTLQRVLPLAHPFRTGFYVDTAEMTDYGGFESRSDFFTATGQPAQDWCIYTLTFVRSKFEVISDKDLAANFNNSELRRYCYVTSMPHPRERRVTSYGFEYLPYGADGSQSSSWLAVPDETAFSPDWTIDQFVKWRQIPVGAIPQKTILTMLNTVNSQPMQLQPTGRIWQPGELLFKGVAQPLATYAGADDSLYQDLEYIWTAQPGGWNSYLARNPIATVSGLAAIVLGSLAAGSPPFQYLPVRVRQRNRPATDPDWQKNSEAPYGPADHNQLFVPSAAA